MLNHDVIKFNAGERLDKAVALCYPQYSRAYLSRLIDSGEVKVNNKTQKAGYKLKAEDDVTITTDLSLEHTIEDVELPIIYEDNDVMVIDKPEGVISHSRGRYWYEPSVASFLRQNTKQGDTNDRTGIVHRLDRATSGVIICAKNEDSLKFLQKQFQDRKVNKTYVAVVKGALPENRGLIDVPIERNPKKPSTFRAGPNGKTAQTDFALLKNSVNTSSPYTLVELKPKTGRTHQLRVHMNFLKHPIVGDQLYGGENAERLMLHAHKLEITLPNKTTHKFTSTIPDLFNSYIS